MSEDQELELMDFTADLVTAKGHIKFLKYLFAQNPSEWQNVRQICEDISEFCDQVKRVEAATAGKLEVIWVDYPQSVYGKGYCLIFFFVESLAWSTHVIYKRDLIIKTGLVESNT